MRQTHTDQTGRQANALASARLLTHPAPPRDCPQPDVGAGPEDPCRAYASAQRARAACLGATARQNRPKTQPPTPSCGIPVEFAVRAQFPKQTEDAMLSASTTRAWIWGECTEAAARSRPRSSSHAEAPRPLRTITRVVPATPRNAQHQGLAELAPGHRGCSCILGP